MNLTEEIRQALDQGPGTIREVAGRLELAGLREQNRVGNRLRDLLRGGQVRRWPSGKGWVYAAAGERRPLNPVQQKIQRAVRLLARKYRVFSWRQAALLSEADHDYLRRVLRFWERAGGLQRAGKQGNLLLYSLGAQWRGKEFPHFNRRAVRKGVVSS
jgi:predicted DNA-binding transcriptional regulator